MALRRDRGAVGGPRSSLILYCGSSQCLLGAQAWWGPCHWRDVWALQAQGPHPPSPPGRAQEVTEKGAARPGRPSPQRPRPRQHSPSRTPSGGPGPVPPPSRRCRPTSAVPTDPACRPHGAPGRLAAHPGPWGAAGPHGCSGQGSVWRPGPGQSDSEANAEQDRRGQRVGWGPGTLPPAGDTWAPKVPRKVTPQGRPIQRTQTSPRRAWTIPTTTTRGA